MPEESMADGVVGQKLPREVEMIMAAFMPNLRHMESRFDRIDLSIKYLSIGIKDTNNRLGALEKRMDYFEVQVDNRFENVDRRFDQIAASIERLGDKLDTR